MVPNSRGGRGPVTDASHGAQQNKVHNVIFLVTYKSPLSAAATPTYHRCLSPAKYRILSYFTLR